MNYNKISKKYLLQKMRNQELKTVDFRNLTEELKGDKEVVLEAIKYVSATIILYISQELRDDKEVVLETVRKNGNLLDEVSERLKDDKDVVLEAVKNSGLIICCASDRLKDDKEIALKMLEVEILQGRGWTLDYCSDRLKNDKDCLELLEKTSIKLWNDDYQKWYQDRMEILANIRDKELIESSIIKSNVAVKKIKF